MAAVFVTGASGYIGSVVTRKLREAGHRVAGLARSDASARKLEALGAEAVRGDLRDPQTWSARLRQAEAVIHLATEFSADARRLDRGAIDTVLDALGDSDKPFLYTSGIWVMGSTGGEVVDESTPARPISMVAWRPAHEELVLRAKGLRGIVIRPAMVYGGDGGFLASVAMAPDAQGVVHYVGSGENRWPFVHVDDLADLYVLALSAAGGSLYFASAGPAIPVKEVARAAAAGGPVASIPLEEARKQMGPLAEAMVLDQQVSGDKAMRELGWKPSGRTVLEELAQRGAADVLRRKMKPTINTAPRPI